MKHNLNSYVSDSRRVSMNMSSLKGFIPDDWRSAVVMATGFTPVFTCFQDFFKSRDSINLGGVSVIFQCPGFSALEEENSRPDPELNMTNEESSAGLILTSSYKSSTDYFFYSLLSSHKKHFKNVPLKWLSFLFYFSALRTV